MKHVRIVAVVAALGALFAGAVLAGGSEAPQKETDAQSAAASAKSGATPADAKAAATKNPKLAGILERGAKVPAEKRERTAAAIRSVEVQINEKAEADGAKSLANRLAAEFDVTPESVQEVREETGASWGNLTIAYTLAGTTGGPATPAELLALQGNGTGWGQIAAGLGMPLGQALKAVQDESRVAMGLEKADGHVLQQLKAETAAQASTQGAVKGAGADDDEVGSEAKSAVSASGGKNAPH